MGQVSTTITTTGTVTPSTVVTNSPYASLDAAIAALNTITSLTGTLTLTSAAGTETTIAGGYVINFTAVTSATDKVVITGTGTTTLTAFTPQTSGNLNDGIFKIIGSDWVTIQNFTMLENAANTTTAAGTNNMTEWGVALLYASTTNGAQNITVQNNTIDLDRTYPNTFGIYSNSTHSATAVTTSATATGAAGGNENLKIYGNNITDVNMGIVHVGPTAAADQNINSDIGGVAVATGNTITNFGTTTTGVSSYANVSITINGILVRNSKNFNVSFNTVNSSNGGVVVGTLNGIQIPASSATPTGTLTQTINNNSISLRPGAVGITVNGINMPSGSVNATTTCSMNNNDFNTFGHTVGGATGTITFFIQGGNPLIQNFNNNTFTNISVNTTGTITFYSFAPSLISTASMSLSGNQIVTGFTRTGAGSTTVWSTNASSAIGSTHSVTNNNFSNVTLTGASAFTGISDTDGPAGGGPTKTVNGNTFSNITTGAGTVVPMSVNFSSTGSTVNNNTITGITTGNSITCLLIGTSNVGTITVTGNKIGVVTSAGTAIIGISTGAITSNTSKNKIYDLSGTVAGSVVSGIAIVNTTASSTVTLSNNLIGNLTAPAATGSNAVIGINITGSATTSAYNVFYNTVYLNNSTSGAGFGSSGISVLASATATTSTLNLRNNIIVNTSIQNGAGLTVAYRRSLGTAGTLANYASTSNNNDFYAGTPSATNLIYSDGTSTAMTIAAYKAGVFTAGTIAPRDGVSISEDPVFQSTSGASANFLKYDVTTPKQIESGGNSSGITIIDDYIGTVRAATPDIGAWELAGILLDLNPPVISYTPLSSSCGTGSRILTTIITDASGVPQAGAGLPVAYWKIGAGSYTAATGVWTTPSTYTFTIGTGSVAGDVISYYIVAQDGAATPNIIASPSGGASGYTANPPAASTPPTTPNSYTNQTTLAAGIYGVGGPAAAGEIGHYATLTLAVADYNNKCLGGNVVFALTDPAYTTGETFPIIINSNLTADATHKLTIKPAASVVANITGAVASGGLIKLNGANYVTIDGSNSGGTDRSLTIENTSTTAPSVIWVGSIGTTATTNNTLKNTIITNGVNTSSAVAITDGGTLGNAGYFNNITLTNNLVQKAYMGIFINAFVQAGNGSGTLVNNNSLNTSGASALRFGGIYLQGVDGGSVSNNTIGNFDNTIAENDFGVWFATGTVNSTISQNTISTLGQITTTANGPLGINITNGVAASNINVTQNTVSGLTSSGGTSLAGISITGTTGGVTIQRNNISGVLNQSTSTFGSYGINVSGGNNNIIRNNFVSNINFDMTGGAAFSTTFGVFGIRIGAGTGHQVYYNSVNMYGTPTGTATSSLLTAAIGIVATTSTGMDIRNNIFANKISGGTTSIAHVAAYLPSGGTSSMGLTWNNNFYYYGTDVTTQGVGQAGTTAGTNFYTTLAAMAAYTSTLSVAGTNDNASLAFTTAVPFTSTTDLHIPAAGNNALYDKGTAVAGVTIDIDNQPRHATSPDVGADEFSYSTLNLTAFIEGYYLGGGLMRPVLLNSGVAGASSSQTDTITVELRNPTTPYGVFSTTKGVLATNGTATINTNPSQAVGNSYYIVLKHRNAVETWSAAPVPINASGSYNFSTAASQAFGNNMVLINGIYAIYSGDLFKDGNVDPLDYSLWETDNNNFAFGYFATDLNGDGNVDPLDYSIWEANNNAFIFANKP